MKLQPMNVRTRLTFWYVAVLATALLIYGVSSSLFLIFQLRSQLDHRAIEELETIKGLLSFTPDGKLLFHSNYQDQSYPTKMLDPLIEVLAEDGTLLYRNELLGNRSLGGALQTGEISGSYAMRSIRLSDGMPIRLVSRKYIIEGHPRVIRLGLSEESLWQRFWEIVAGLLAGLPLVLAFAGLGGYFLARHALGPIERMARRVHEINAERLNARLEIENPHDELGFLGSTFNETLGRLQRSFEQLRRFTADASHELRTPLTAIRSVGEVGLQKSCTIEDYRDVIASMLEESARLTRLVESLLTIARADSGQIQLERTDVVLLPLVREVTSVLEVLAEEKGQKISVAGDETLEVQADVSILRQVLTNLLDNALKYSYSGGRISVRVLSTGNHSVAVEVEDNGPGIPWEHRDKIFDRFYRVDEGRSRDSGGVGLGLAIAKWGAEAHEGHLELVCPSTGGCIFRLVLPTKTALKHPSAMTTTSSSEIEQDASVAPLSSQTVTVSYSAVREAPCHHPEARSDRA
jgi:heavy metal sensor kinase